MAPASNKIAKLNVMKEMKMYKQEGGCDKLLVTRNNWEAEQTYSQEMSFYLSLLTTGGKQDNAENRPAV
jgi:hypothetical protein